MEVITNAVSSLFTMLGSAYDFITDKPLLLLMCAVPLVGGIVALITSIFRRGG